MLRGLLLIMCIGFAALFAMAVTQRDEMCHRAEVAEARTVEAERRVEFYMKLNDAKMEPFEERLLETEKRAFFVRRERDSLAHLADSLRERRSYWWAVAHADSVTKDDRKLWRTSAK